MAFPLFLGFRYQNYKGKAIFMPLSIGVGIVIISNYPRICDLKRCDASRREIERHYQPTY
jgi:hypothetical protein